MLKNCFFSEEIAPDVSGRPNGKKASVNWQERGQLLLERIEKKLIQETNFRPLFDYKANLFTLGYHADRNTRDEVLYDLMASEARIASFVAIALGQVSVSHWHVLGRTMTKVGKHPVLLSWTGTMFEYLMPWLLMRTYRNTLWEKHTQRLLIAKLNMHTSEESRSGSLNRATMRLIIK
ncbi:hypothetical protein GCM10020331_102370 [Ectobacillus funiculus]